MKSFVHAVLEYEQTKKRKKEEERSKEAKKQRSKGRIEGNKT
jgi:hypothetical protein